MQTKDIILVALICVNVSLAAVALILYVGDVEPAAHAADSMRYGDYVMVSGPIADTREAVLIIDVVAKRANLYVPSAGTTAAGVAWELKDSRDLSADFGRRTP
jgi:hypothetical protein